MDSNLTPYSSGAKAGWFRKEYRLQYPENKMPTRSQHIISWYLDRHPDIAKKYIEKFDGYGFIDILIIAERSA